MPGFLRDVAKGPGSEPSESQRLKVCWAGLVWLDMNGLGACTMPFQIATLGPDQPLDSYAQTLAVARWNIADVRDMGGDVVCRIG